MRHVKLRPVFYRCVNMGLFGVRSLLILLLSVFSGLAHASARDCTKLLTKEDFDSFAKEVSEDWKEVEEEYRWSVWIDSDLDYRRFMNPVDMAAKPGVHPTEVYKNGTNQYRSYVEAEKFLDAIPVGEFKPSLEMFKQIHTIAMKDVYSLREKLAYRLGGGLLNVSGPGKFKRYFNFGFNPLVKYPLTDAEVAAIRISGTDRFLSFFRKGPEQNYGLIVFPGNPQKKLEELIGWYEANRPRLSAIQLAAGFQKRFIAIHPFDNGNGRVSRLLMNRILAEAGLPPAILKNQNLDLFLSEADWAKEIAGGVAEFQELSKTVIRDTKKTKTAKGAPFVGDRDHGSWIRGKNGVGDLMTNGLLPEKGKALFRLQNGESFLLYRDGFFYNQEGIPHLYRQGALHPVADSTYILYGMGGKITEGPVDFERGIYPRTLSPQQQEIYKGNLEFAEGIRRGEIDSSKILVMPYEKVMTANAKGIPYFHPTDIKWLRESLKITDESSAAILAANRGGFTEYEQAFQAGGSLRISSILAQYQTVDLNYARLENFFRKIEPDSELVDVITNSRKKLWEAGRDFFGKFEEQATEYGKEVMGAAFNRDEWLVAMRGHPQFKLLYEYLPYTRIGYSDWSAATAAVPLDRIFLLRNDFQAMRWTGFLTEAQFAGLIKSIPGAGLFRKYVAKRLQGLTDEVAQGALDVEGVALSGGVPKIWKFKKIYEALEKKIFVSPYLNRGVDIEFQRMYVDLFLHSVDAGQKSGISFSVRADQMVRTNGDLAFQGIPGTNYRTYIVEMPVGQAVNNFASGWFRQYEVIGLGYTAPTKVVKSFKPEDFVPKLDPALLNKVEDFNANKQRILLSPLSKKP